MDRYTLSGLTLPYEFNIVALTVSPLVTSRFL